MTKIAQLGFWAAIGACAASITYGVAQLLQVAGLLGDTAGRIAIFVPSLILAPFFVATLAAAHDAATPVLPRLRSVSFTQRWRAWSTSTSWAS